MQIKKAIQYISNDFRYYGLSLVLFESLASIIGLELNFGIIFGILYFFMNLVIGYYTKEWEKVVIFLLVVPYSATMNFLAVTNNLNVNANIFYAGLVLVYAVFWCMMAWSLERRQYQCAASFITALFTTGIGLGSFYVFIIRYGSENIDVLSMDATLKLVVMGLSVFFIADKWGKFTIDLKEIKLQIK